MKSLVIGNWDFKKKVLSQKRKAVVNLEEDDLDEPCNTKERNNVPNIEYEQMNSYDMIKFKKNEDFEFIIDQMMEFQREVYETYPHLRQKKKKCGK